MAGTSRNGGTGRGVRSEGVLGPKQKHESLERQALHDKSLSATFGFFILESSVPF